ncbi:MAG: hypothetical protein IKD66_11820 [Solobacterium sp.]|nr:hypothetical protein [Solobacterium sp.]
MNKFWIYPCAGLGNRLLALLSAVYWHELSGNRMVVLWKQETACNAEMEDLFSLDCADTEIVRMREMTLRKPAEALAILKLKAYEFYLYRTAYALDNDPLLEVYHTEGMEGIRRLMEQPRLFLRSYSAFADEEVIRKASSRLKISPKILEHAEENLGGHDGRKTVGVHIRRTDNQRSIQQSPLSLFIDEMKRRKEEDPETVFYLATDDLNVRRELSQAGIDYITGQVRSLRRDDPSGIEDAFAEMITLSKCRMILGSYGSTFSYIASLIGDNELRILKKTDESFGD